MKTIELLNRLRGAGTLSLLDPLVFLTIATHPESGKSDLVEIIYGSRDATKSSLDSPVRRLIEIGLVIENRPDRANRKAGDALKNYALTTLGEEWAKGIK